MSQKFVFEELDSATREYLLAVRASEGEGSPGVFAPTNASMAGCGCIAGPILIGLTLLLTLTTWLGVIYKDPTRVAFLQTAGLLLGGWLVVAGIRSNASKGSSKVAGHWVYVDSLYLYEAYREQVTVTPIDDVIEAKFTHNYNNGAYQNSVVSAQLGDGHVVSVTLNNEQRAEQMVVYLNYLAWARSPEGGDRGRYAPASLGALARYVSVHGVEPKNHEDQIDLNQVELEITEVPEEPTREGRAAPAILPYVLILAAGAGIFFVMKGVVNPPLRDDAIFEAVIKEPCEPSSLRAYLMDERCTRHRPAVQARLEQEYDKAIRALQFVDPNANPRPDPSLRDGMVQVLDSLKSADQPFVSLSVSEKNAKPGAAERVKNLRDKLVGRIDVRDDGGVTVGTDGIYGQMARIFPPVSPPAGMTFEVPRAPVGVQLIGFAEKPEEATNAHFEVKYEFVQIGSSPNYSLDVEVEIRTNVDPQKGNTDPVARYEEKLVGRFTAGEFDEQLLALRDRLVRGLVGSPPAG
jgi:hypothetical protein